MFQKTIGAQFAGLAAGSSTPPDPERLDKQPRGSHNVRTRRGGPMPEIHTYLEFLTALDDRPLRLQERDTLFEEGQRSDGRMFVVRTGSVLLRSGRKQLERVGPGGIVGEMALIDPAPRSATAVAGPDCTVSAVTEPMLHKLVAQVPGLALEMMRILVRRLRQATAVQRTKPRPATRGTKRVAKPKPKPRRR
jgi:CRP-like cAMP-binding protein